MSGYLCDDLIGEIFKRLPAKSLVRFRCVSKSWYSRICSPYFRHRQYLHGSRQKTVMIRKWESSVCVRKKDCHGRNQVKDLYCMLHSDEPLCHGYFDFDPNEFHFPLSKVVNSCNGIFCVFDYHENPSIHLWNPSIRRKLTLPDPPCLKHLSLGVGLGFDPISDDYKVVCISYVKFSQTVENTFVYSIKAATWSCIASPVTPFDILQLQACELRGVLHWVTHLCTDSLMESYILTFDLSTHVFGKIMLPEPVWFTRKPTIINGCLAVVSCQHVTGDTSIFVMKDYNNVASWYVLFKRKVNEKDQIKSVMQLSNSAYFLICNYGYGLQVYNHVTGVTFDLPGTRVNRVYMETCRESLELLDIGELI